MVLLTSGYSRRKALVFNFFSSLASVVGGLVGYFLLEDSQAAYPTFSPSPWRAFIYIAVADLIPHMHPSSDARSTGWQLGLIVVGGATIVTVNVLFHKRL